MAKFDISINGVDQGVAEGREAWAGELPPTGSYSGILKTLSISEIGEGSKYAGAPRLAIGVELRGTPGGKYDGFVAWGSLNMIEGAEPYINQFLLALTDGSDAQFEKIKQAFYVTKAVTDERGKHITDIGRWHVNSPKGELPIKVSLKNAPRKNPRTEAMEDRVEIVSYLLNEDNPNRGGDDGGISAVVEDEVVSVVAEDDEAEALLNN